ncbi:NAD(P)-binding domain-containing protein [Ectobacillus funiculus]
MIKSKVLQELGSITDNCLNTVATVGMTSRKSVEFAVLPRRKALGFEAINFLVSSSQAAEECLRILDGRVKYIFIDVEAKKNLNLEYIAENNVKSSVIIPYKPNDATVEAADLFLLQYFKEAVREKEILIYGAGNIAGKLALRLAERGSNVYVFSRDYKKVELISEALNFILPRYSVNKIIPIENIKAFTNSFDAVISFISAERVIDDDIICSLKEKALVLDGGINNFTPQFYEIASQKLLNCFRLDVRLGFLYTLLPLLDDVRAFFNDVQGKAFVDNITIVSGGIIGASGDIIVDNIKHPRQVIGIANGLGGLKDTNDYTVSDQENLTKVQKFILAMD